MFIRHHAWRPLRFRCCWLSTESIERLKRPTRGGQNLSKRYRRLEKSLRGKEALAQSIQQESSRSIPPPVRGADDTDYFRGFVVPKEPKVPEADECCMSGCAICVYDLYQESLDHYHASLMDLQTELSSLRIPESEWPARVRASRAKNVVLDAFQEMERALSSKREPAGRHHLPD